MTTAIVSDQDLLNAQLAAVAAADALRQAERDESGSLDAQLNRIEQLAAAEHRARMRHERLQTLAEAQHQADADRLARETEFGPQIAAAASRLAASTRKGTALINAAVNALRDVLTHFEQHEAAVVDARILLDSAKLAMREESGDHNGVLRNGQGMVLDGVHYPPTPPWAVARATYIKALGALPFTHEERRKFELYDQAHQVSAVRMSGLFTDPPETKERKSKNADA